MTVDVLAGDCLDVMRGLSESSVDAVVTDPPYMLKFMGKRWDDPGSFVERRPDRAVKFDQQAGNHNPSNPQDAVRTRLVEGRRAQEFHELWALEAFRVLKPGGHLVAFGGSRTYHRLACAIEDAGFEIRDQIMWLYGSGFNKNGYLSYQLERTLCERRDGKNYYVGTSEEMQRAPPFRHPDADSLWGQAGALKPAHEPIVLARKPLSEPTVAANVLRHGTGALNVDGCRVEGTVPQTTQGSSSRIYGDGKGFCPESLQRSIPHTAGRWPANVAHDGSDEVMEAFARFGKSKSGVAVQRNGGGQRIGNTVYSGSGRGLVREDAGFGDSGTAARFFSALGFSEDELRFRYCAKASRAERAGSKHPTIKPLALMRWLVRLVTPPGGTVLDPFAGSGTTGEAAKLEGLRAILIEREAEYIPDIRARIDRCQPDLLTPAA